jgi:predicted lipoprotein with Yx(FWY)xxD motif
MKLFIPAVLVAAIAAIVIALSTGGTSNASKTGRSGALPAAAADSALALRSTPLGRILVDAHGRTLYLFEADKPDMSDCSGACQSIWPALTSHGKPKADAGVRSSEVGTIAAAGGQRQVTYDGHPLYYYAADRKAGDTAGQGLDQFGAEWYVLGASGRKIDNG